MSESLTLIVQRSERMSPGFQRITLGRGDIGRFVPLGFDRWFLLVLPTGDDQDAPLRRLPARLDPSTVPGRAAAAAARVRLGGG